MWECSPLLRSSAPLETGILSHPLWHQLGRGEGEQWVLNLALQIKNPRQCRLVLLTRIPFILNPIGEKKVFSPYWLIFQISFYFLWTSSCFLLKFLNSEVGA